MNDVSLYGASERETSPTLDLCSRRKPHNLRFPAAKSYSKLKTRTALGSYGRAMHRSIGTR